MPNFFGVDIAQEVANTFEGEIPEGILTKRTAGTRTPGNLTGGTNQTETTYTFSGFLDNRSEKVMEGTVVQKGGQIVVIIANTLSNGTVQPEPNDKITIEGISFEISSIPKRDPAAATYEVLVEE